MANPFLQTLLRTGAGFAAGMSPPGVGQFVFDRLNQQREQERLRETMDPFRRAVLDQIQGPKNVFAGGPASDFAGQGATPAPADPSRSFAVQPDAPPPNPALTPPPEIDAILISAAERYNVPVNALRVLAAQESSFNPQAVNQPTPGDPTDPGARGLFQFTERTAKDMGIDPFNVAQAADATAQMLARELARGVPIEEAMTAHFGGPDRSMWGPNTQKYRQDVTQKYQSLQPVGEAPPVGGEQLQPGQSKGPFGTVVNEPGQGQTFGQKLLELAARDPDAFTQMFAGEGGLEQIQTLMQEGGGFSGTLSEGQKAFKDGRVVAENPRAGADVRARVYGGDSAVGRSLGIPLGERARVEETFDENGNIVARNVVGRFGAGQEININNTGPDEFEKVNAKTINDAIDRIIQFGENAESMLPNLRRSGELLVEGLNTGRGQALLLPIRQFAEDLGVPLEQAAESLGITLGGNRLADQEEFDRLAKQVVLDSYAKTKGNLNAQEATVVEQSVNNFGRSEESNMRAIAALQAAAEVAAERRQQAISQATDLGSARSFLSTTAASGAEAIQARTEELLQQMQGAAAPVVGGPGRYEEPATAPRSSGAPADVQAAVPQGMSLGTQTADGRWEVVDSSGNVVGHIEP